MKQTATVLVKVEVKIEIDGFDGASPELLDDFARIEAEAKAMFPNADTITVIDSEVTESTWSEAEPISPERQAQKDE